VCQQDNSKSYGRIFLKFWGYVGHGINYQWFNFGGDPAGILDSESLWNFRYHCVKGGIREPLAKRRWWRHLANNIALAEVPAGYDCFLVIRCVGLDLHIIPASWRCWWFCTYEVPVHFVRLRARLAAEHLSRCRRFTFNRHFLNNSHTLAYLIPFAPLYCSTRISQDTNSSLREIVFILLFVQFFVGLVACKVFLIFTWCLCLSRY